MLHSRENTLHLTQLSMAAIEQLSPSFEAYLVRNMPTANIVFVVTLWLGLKTVRWSI